MEYTTFYNIPLPVLNASAKLLWLMNLEQAGVCWNTAFPCAPAAPVVPQQGSQFLLARDVSNLSSYNTQDSFILTLTLYIKCTF